MRLPPRRRAGATDSCLELRAQDGYRVSLLLADALAPEVLLADRLNGEPLSTEHGARRVAFEERGRGLPGWLYRILYRALFRPIL